MTKYDHKPGEEPYPMNLLSLLEHGPVTVETTQTGDGGVMVTFSGADLELRDGDWWGGHRSRLSTRWGWSRIFDYDGDDCRDDGGWPEVAA